MTEQDLTNGQIVLRTSFGEQFFSGSELSLAMEMATRAGRNGRAVLIAYLNRSTHRQTISPQVIWSSKTPPPVARKVLPTARKIAV